VKAIASIAVALLITASPGRAAFSHMDIEAGDWVTWGMVADYYHALRERYAAVGLAWVDGEQTYASGTGTVTYTWGQQLDAANPNTVFLRRDVMDGLDDRLAAVYPYYVAYWEAGAAVDGTLDAYFEGTNALAPPMATLGSVCAHAGIGWSDGTNGNLTAVWPSAQSNDALVMAEFYASTNVVKRSVWNTYLPADVYNYAWATCGVWRVGTNPAPVVSGTVLVMGVATTTNTVQTDVTRVTNNIVDLPDVNEFEPMDARWFGITGLVATASVTGTGVAAFAVGYRHPFALYGSPGSWYTLPAAALVERYKFLDALRWTWVRAHLTNGVRRSGATASGSGLDGTCAVIGPALSADYALTSWSAADSAVPGGSVAYNICTQGLTQAEAYRDASDVTCSITAQVYTVGGAAGDDDYTLTAQASIYAKFEGSTADTSAFATFADTSPVDGRLVRLADVAVDSATAPVAEDIGRTDTDPTGVWPCEDPPVDCEGDDNSVGWGLVVGPSGGGEVGDANRAIAGAVVVWDFQYVIE